MAMTPGSAAIASKMAIIFGVILFAACTSRAPQTTQAAMKIEPAIIAVADPGLKIPRGASFAWLDKAINLYSDERLDSTTIQYLIEQSIKSNLAERGFRFVEDASDAEYTIAYTAALESSLDDGTILRRFGLVPGNMRVPDDNPLFEKGTLLIYVFDGSDRDVVWRSAVQAAVDFSIEDAERKQRIERVIQDMFSAFPVQ